MSEFYKALCQGSVIEISKRSSRRLREVLSKCQGRVQQVREASKLRNALPFGKSPKAGGGVSSENQKVHNSKFGLFEIRVGGSRFLRFKVIFKAILIKCF